MTASGVEAASIAGRVSSSVLTIGWLNPIYGMAETVLAMIVTLLAVWVPILAGGMVLLLLPIVLFAVWRILAWRSKQRRAHEQKLQQARERIASSISHHADRMGAAAGRPPAASA
jgi:fatty acid desaturase